MPINSLSADLDAIIAHAGVAVTIGSITGSGVLRTEEMQVGGDFGVIGTFETLTVRDGVFSGLAQDVAVVAGGVNYKIRDPGRTKTDGTRKLVLVPAVP